jgi:hypothetical protein
MIKLFKNIRRQLVNENKFGKYLRYAIGEIILVVVGILIALWINQKANYNEERNSEIAILKEIQSNLERDLIEINEDIAFMDSVNDGSHFIVHYLEHFDKPNSEFNHNVLKLRTTPHLNPNTSGYRLLVSKGVEIIQNDNLRQAISDHYESYYPYYLKYEQERIDFRIKYIESELLKYFSWTATNHTLWLGEYRITDHDYTLLKNEGTFYKLTQATNRENNLVQNRALRIKQNMLDLLSLLAKELSTKI